MKTELAKKKDLRIWFMPGKQSGTGEVIFRSTGAPYAVAVPEINPDAEPTPDVAGLRAFDQQLMERRREAHSKLMLESNPELQNWVVPKDEDFLQVNFRALSQRVIPGHWLDFTKPGVLEESAPLLLGARVVETHWDWRPSEFLGTVVESEWDNKGERSQNVPGINVKLMIDALWNPRVARGLMLRPFPAINESSVSVHFEYEFSHPELLEKGFWYYWDSLGEDVAPNGIVRFIVTKILKYPHYALVVEGADSLANQHIDDEDDDEEPDVPQTTGKKKRSGMNALSSITGAKIVKLSKEQIKLLGMPDTTPDEVPDEAVLSQVEGLAARAAIGDQALQAARENVLRDARICEQLAADAPLPLALRLSIENANWEQLRELQEFYGKKAAALFPASGRSSQEAQTSVPAATVNQKVSVF